MSAIEPSHPLTELLLRDKRYAAEAYVFVFEALGYAQEQLGLRKSTAAEIDEEEDEDEEDRHVTGQQLCQSIRKYAIDQYGLMAQCVLNTWGVRETGDFGQIVFNLIDIGQMRKTDTDRREDFENVYDFDKAFRKNFKIGKPRPTKERRS